MKMEEYDIAVIGAGAAGLAAATETATAGRSTLIIHIKVSLKFGEFVWTHLRGVPAVGQCAHQNPAYPAKPKANPEILFVVVAFFFGGFKEPFGNEIVEDDESRCN